MNLKWLSDAGAWLLVHKVLLGILLFPAALGVTAVALLVVEHVRGSVSLGRYIRVLTDQGEKMSPREFKLPSPTGENGAREVLTATEDLKEGTILPKIYPPRMKLTPAGHAVVCFQEEAWKRNQVTYHWEQLAADLETNVATLERIRRAMGRPVLDCVFDPSLGPKASFSHVAVPKTLAQWFGSRVQLGLHMGKAREVLADLLTEIDLPRMLARDKIAISELVRDAIAAIARGDTWEALQADGWTEDDLARIQRIWEKQEFNTAMVHAMEGERVFARSSYVMMRKSNPEAVSVLYGLEEYQDEHPQWEEWLRELPGGEAAADFLKKQVYCRVWRFAWLEQDELRYLRYLERLIALGRDGAEKKSLQELQAAVGDLAFKFQNQGLYNRLRYPSVMSVNSLSRVFSRAMRAETERSLVLAAIALKCYALRHGSLPQSLSALVPELLPSVPVDYMDGQPLRLRPQPEGGLVLYSVGEDGKDNGGDASLRSGKTNLRIFWERKDVVWPAPATAEEVEAYRVESAKN